MIAVMPPLIKKFIEEQGIDPSDVMELTIRCAWDRHPEVEVRMKPSADRINIEITKELQDESPTT